MSRAGRTETEVRYARIVGANVHALRTAKGMSAQTIVDKARADGVPLTTATIFRIEHGRSFGKNGHVLPAVTVDQLMAFATALGTTAQTLLTDRSVCPRCGGSPAPGYTCNDCGAGRA